MAVRWFDAELDKYPPLIIAIMERVRVYFAQKFYPNLEYTFTSTKTDPIEKEKEEVQKSGKKRFILTDMADRPLPDNIRVFHESNGIFPFTVFNYGELDIDTSRFNMFANSGQYYDNTVQCKIESRPTTFHVSMITFFTTGFDYFRAQSLLNQDSSTKTLLWVPISINSIVTQIPILLEYEALEKGTYAYQFNEQLNVGRIQDIVHDVTIHYHDLITSAAVAPVDYIDLYLRSYSGEDYQDNVQSDYRLMPDIPTITSTTPTTGVSGVLVDSQILINFSEEMRESSVEPAIHFEPYISMDFIWNSNSTSIIIEPFYNLISGTLYSGTIYTTAESAFGIPLENDFTFYFTTEGVAP